MSLTVFLSGYEYKKMNISMREKKKRKNSQVTFACKHNRN